MPTNYFLNSEWRSNHLRKVRAAAGSRYTPELNVELPINEVLDSLSRTKEFYTSIRQHHGALRREFNAVSSQYSKAAPQRLYRQLKAHVDGISGILGELTEYSTDTIPWKQVKRHSEQAQNLTWRLSDKLRAEKDELKKSRISGSQEEYPTTSDRYGFAIHHLHKTQTELRFFEELSGSVKAQLSNSPRLLLTGLAGTGKTHLLCDVLKRRYKSYAPLPGVLVFGESFASSADPLSQINRLLGLKSKPENLLRHLNNAGRQSRCRAILAIDALNETPRRHYWKLNLGKLVREVQNYPHVALVISVRSGFENEVIPKKWRKVFAEEEHRGFEFREWEAITKFFHEFNLPLPEIPLLLPEFQNPLFLQLFCRAFRQRVRKKRSKKPRQIFRGHEGATYIFESFVKSVSNRIRQQFGLPAGTAHNVWNLIIEKIAAEMVNASSDRISEERFLAIVRAAYPLIDHEKFTLELERNLLVVKFPVIHLTTMSTWDSTSVFHFKNSATT